MRTFITLSLITLFHLSLMAQTIVSTVPENKRAILEEFTGTGCSNCPGGHTLAANLLTANPHQLFILAYHPSNSSYTSSDPMASSYPAAFYTQPFISPSNRYMPCAMISRRVWGGVERIQGTANWTSDVATIRGEPSPLNVGVTSSYEETGKILSVTAEVYFTADVTSSLTIYAMLLESGIVATQSGGTSPYTHNHVFRHAFVAQWGDDVAAPTTQGTLKTFTFTFDNSVKNYDMTQGEVVVFIRDAGNEEIISGNGAAVNETTPISIEEPRQALSGVTIYPNPAREEATISATLAEPGNVNITISNLAGQVLHAVDYGSMPAGNHLFRIDDEIPENAGIYLVKVQTGSQSAVQKLMVP